VEVSSRTVNAWALMRPCAELSDVTVGVLGRSLEISPVEIVAISCLSNHYHALLVAEDQQQLSRFMQHFQGNLSQEIARLVGWDGPLWSRRYDGIIVSDEPEVQWARLRYVLGAGAKEGLVESPLEWPGVHAAWERYESSGTKKWGTKKWGRRWPAIACASLLRSRNWPT
ncbi:MAG: hypothetical protein GY835_03150, partial [bacterium]|nr:hypothetical protein [bacterium]